MVESSSDSMTATSAECPGKSADTTPGALSRLFGADSSRIFGHGAPMTNGTATSELCTSATTVFAWSANPVQACGS